MKILTLNTWQERGPWRDRWKIILEGLKSHCPDVAGFQEVFNSQWAREIQKLSGYPYLVYPEESRAGGLMFLSRYPVTSSACLTMKTQSPTESYRRYALFMESDTGEKKVSFFNTHLSWRILESEIREKQVGELLSFIEGKVPKAGNPAIVMGDFNAPPETPEVERMVGAGGFADSFAAKNPGQAGLTWDNANSYAAGSSVRMPDRRIDYLLTRGVNLSRIQSVQRVYTEPEKGVFASDHYGVLIEIE